MIPWLDPKSPPAFPSSDQALPEPNGLIAAGGQLTPTWLLHAYRRGLFPWYAEGQPILWWTPNPRCVLFPDRIRISRSLRKRLRQQRFEVSLDLAFGDVIHACAEPRADDDGTWITRAVTAGYQALHREGHAHSVEVWEAGTLVGGLYGVSIGQVFFGESMFSRVSDASKIALVYLCAHLRQWGFRLVDCQITNPHLISLGAEEIPRSRFEALLAEGLDRPGPPSPWRLDPDIAPATPCKA